MSRLQTTRHKKVRTILRVAGPLALLAGVIFFIVGLIDFFSSFGGFGPPRLFWCFFVGGPLVFIGTCLCMFGYMGAMARFVSAEQVPVVTDAAHDLADGTQEAVTTVARAVTKGVKEGLSDEE